MRIKVAFWFDAPTEYSGGLNYVANLLYALSIVNDGTIEPYVFLAPDVPESVYRRLGENARIVKTEILQRRTVPWFLHKVSYKLFGTMFFLNRILKKNGIELVSHLWIPYKGSRQVKVISWIPDFQYLHFPELFPKLNQESETKINMLMAINADMVVVSSQHALEDLKRVVPFNKIKAVEVLQFVSQPVTSVENSKTSIQSLQKKYGFNGKFFLLPNQFWAHKNHQVVLDALLKTKQDGFPMVVLFTGNTKDYRLAGTPYLDGLNAFIKEYSLEREARILGMIEYDDLLCLMRYCVAVINPSLFEGWSSSVEEAKSIGKTVLLSKIPVHVEQNPCNGHYFDPDDSLYLGELMTEVWGKLDLTGPDDSSDLARKSLHERTMIFGRKYMEILQSVMRQ